MNSLKRWGIVSAAAALSAVGVLSAGAVASAGDGHGEPFTVSARLSGYQEDPAALSTTGQGTIRLRIDPDAQTIRYTLRYANLEGAVLQAHIHLGGKAQSGSISAFLCSNIGNGPAGTAACPTTNPGEVRGTITPASVVGPTGQGIAPGEFAELLAAVRADTTYANVHSDKYPGGEIRSQLLPHDH